MLRAVPYGKSHSGSERKGSELAGTAYGQRASGPNSSRVRFLIEHRPYGEIMSDRGAFKATFLAAESAITSVEYLVSHLERTPGISASAAVSIRGVIARMRLNLETGRVLPADVERSALSVETFLLSSALPAETRTPAVATATGKGPGAANQDGVRPCASA